MAGRKTQEEEEQEDFVFFFFVLLAGPFFFFFRTWHGTDAGAELVRVVRGPKLVRWNGGGDEPQGLGNTFFVACFTRCGAVCLSVPFAYWRLSPSPEHAVSRNVMSEVLNRCQPAML